MLPLGSEDEWQLYKSCASGLKGIKVVTEIAPLPVDEINVQKTGVTTEEWQGVTHRVRLGSELAKTNSKALNLVVVMDDKRATFSSHRWRR
jgi:hypothetical protein